MGAVLLMLGTILKFALCDIGENNTMAAPKLPDFNIPEQCIDGVPNMIAVYVTLMVLLSLCLMGCVLCILSSIKCTRPHYDVENDSGFSSDASTCDYDNDTETGRSNYHDDGFGEVPYPGDPGDGSSSESYNSCESANSCVNQ